MSTGTWCSEGLGTITDEQFQAVADQFNLGRFLSASPIKQGLFGQNVFFATREGEFVLRGAPHWVRSPGEAHYHREDRWQFTSERYFARALHESTQTPVPWPMSYDPRCTIFEWPYLVMPRMPGTSFEDASFAEMASDRDRSGVAQALATNLVEMQRLRHPFAGSFDVNTIELRPYANGFTGHIVSSTRQIMHDTLNNNQLDAADVGFIERICEAATTAGERPVTYVHVDYKLGNMTVAQDPSGAWKVSGLFDFHEANFGDGALDNVRQYCAFLDHSPGAANHFARTYFSLTPVDDALHGLMPLYVLNDRLKIWGYFTQPGVASPFPAGARFNRWAARYLRSIMAELQTA